MAAVTATIAAGATLAGMGLQVGQLVKQNKLQKEATNAAEAAASKISGMEIQNAYAGLQVPTLGYELAQEGLDRQTMGALQAAQGAGAEGVIGGVGRINEAANEQQLNMMAQLQQDEATRDKIVAAGQQEANKINFQKDLALEEARLTGAQQAAAQAQLNKQQAISGMIDLGVSGLGYANSLAPLYQQGKAVDLSQISKDTASVQPLLNLMSQPKIY
jgi:hypothetical protein